MNQDAPAPPKSAAPPSLAQTAFDRYSFLAIEVRVFLALLLCLLVGWLVYRTFLATNLDSERRIANARLNFYAQSIEATMTRHEAMPWLLALEKQLSELLLHPQDPARVAEVNQYLETTQNLATLSAAYLMNDKGDTLAASNWNRRPTFVGQNYAFRPYFRQALNGQLGRFYAIGSTTGEAGYFLAAPVRHHGRTLGVVAIKGNLNALEEAFARSGEMILLADADGVVFLSSAADWKYRSLTPLPPAVVERLQQTRQYVGVTITPLARDKSVDAKTGSVALRLPREVSTVDRLLNLQIQTHQIGSLGWQLVLLTNPENAVRGAVGAGVAAGFALAFVLGTLVYFRLRRLRAQDQIEAARELQRVHDELEQRIFIRTADLLTANTALEEKVGALKQTESILRETRDSAVQAGKLAVLGQMAAGMSHELNQPLAALNVLSDNAINLLKRGQLDETGENLSLISQLTERMGRIVKQLKSFARKGPLELSPVSMEEVIDYALLIVEPRRREVNAVLERVPLSGRVTVLAEPVRLEQVLVNLLRNALDASAGLPTPKITIAVAAQDDEVRISIRDSGPGISPEVLPHLFEPFYTTKATGQGLGLGLAISLTIIQGFGGKLEADNPEDGGAQFVITLSAA